MTRMPDAPMYATSYDDYPANNYPPRTTSSGQTSSNALPPIPGEEAPAVSQLHRHPTGRQLPVPVPSDSDSYDEGDGNAQDPLYRELENMVGGQTWSRHQISQPDAPMTADHPDLLDGELEGFPRRGSGHGAINPTNDAVTPTQAQGNYDFQDDSDAEAAAGLEAMRLADEQESHRGSGDAYSLFGHENSHDHSKDHSSDSDYPMGVDLGMLGGGYDVRMPYGNDDLAVHSEMQDQSRPLPALSDIRRPEAHEPAPGLGGMTDYGIPGDDIIHPFRQYEPAADSFGTGGLQRPGSQSHRLSFDEGDERSVGSRVDSRQSGYSESDSPSRDDYPEMFYHPGMSQTTAQSRPLPAVPPQLRLNTTPQLQPSASYRNNVGQPSYPPYAAPSKPQPQPSYLPDGPDSYPQHDLLNAGTQFVPRSASLTSHSSTPVVVPPARSRTDAEERQARQRALRGAASNGLDGYGDAGTPSAPLDLPALPPTARRKKVTVDTVRSSDYKKCREPWALSDVSAWIKEMCGGESGDGEADLREKTISDLLIALFTHKVPTMNTADAEVISAGVVAHMLQAGVLVRDEEWVRFGPGTISGVLWQMSGSGCYSPRLHDVEIPGRCYSHHCHRTLKKINLHTQKLEPAKQALEWHEFFKLTKEQAEAKGKHELTRQNNLHEIIKSEDKYMGQLDVLRVIYRDDLSSWQPPIISLKKLPAFVKTVFGRVEAVKKVNMDHLLAQLKYRQIEQGPWIVGFSDIFREWIRRAKQVYLDYAAAFPHATFTVRKEADRNVLFRQFLDQAQANSQSNRLDWYTYLFSPLKRLQQYPLLLKEVLKHSHVDNEEKVNLQTALDEVTAVVHDCDTKLDEENKKVEMAELHLKLFLRPGMEKVELQLDHLGRELIYQGDLQRAGANRFTWLETRAILFDHYLVLAKTVIHRDSAGQKRKEIYDVSKLVSSPRVSSSRLPLLISHQPIPMQLLVLESTNDEPVVKSSMKGLGAVTTVSRTAQSNSATLSLSSGGRASTASDRPLLEHTGTNASINSLTKVDSNTSQADRAMYPFRIKHLGKSEVYTLYAPSAQNRSEWCEKIILAKERHAASLFKQNAEPFRLNVLADSAFAVESLGLGRNSTIAIRGTPLDRAVKEMDRQYGHARPVPICRAQVNCATTFSVYGKQMIAVGTDYGVYTSEVGHPREWARAIVAARVTQIAVLEDFSLCLVIADKALIAYHLDVVVPVAGGFPAPGGAAADSARRAPQKLSGSREVSFFATARMKDRTLVFYKKREGISSTFKVLEPILQRSSERQTRLFGRSRGGLGSKGKTEFFREFDEFYIPAECFSINLFTTYIAISTARGFELLSLDKKIPMSIPDLKNVGIAQIAARLGGQKPLGMFRLSAAEFLMCYEECGVYVDKHGEVSRGVVLEFVGKAKSAAMYGAYLVLFDSDFVEVRNAENGRLRQVIAGKDVRCLDYGVAEKTKDKDAQPERNRHLKVAMQHPDFANVQLVVELVLNEGQRE